MGHTAPMPPMPPTAQAPSDSPAPVTPGLVACLCAGWCDLCTRYRAVFDELAGSHPGWCFRWVDIEDEADALETLPGGTPDIENFPTLLVATADGQGFWGPVLPHAELAHRLLRQAASGELPALTPAALDLAALLRQTTRRG